MLGTIPASPRIPSEAEGRESKTWSTFISSLLVCTFQELLSRLLATLTEPMHRALVLKLFDKEATMTTLAHQGRNTTFLETCSAGSKTTRSEVRFSKIQRVNDVVFARLELDSALVRNFDITMLMCVLFQTRTTRMSSSKTSCSSPPPCDLLSLLLDKKKSDRAQHDLLRTPRTHVVKPSFEHSAGITPHCKENNSLQAHVRHRRAERWKNSFITILHQLFFFFFETPR